MEVALPARRLPRAPAPAPLLTGQMPTHSSCSHGCRSMTAGLPTRVLRQHSADPGEPHCPQCPSLLSSVMCPLLGMAPQISGGKPSQGASATDSNRISGQQHSCS